MWATDTLTTWSPARMLKPRLGSGVVGVVSLGRPRRVRPRWHSQRRREDGGAGLRAKRKVIGIGMRGKQRAGACKGKLGGIV